LKDDKEFWKEINRTKNKNLTTNLPDTVGEHTGQNEIASMWKEYFGELLNSSTMHKDTKYKPPRVDEDPEARIEREEIRTAVKNLNNGKSPGADGICVEHIKYSDELLYDLLASAFNCFITHGHLPKDFMFTLIIPRIKDKKGDLSDCDNYRPIALTSVISKLFELVILGRIKHLLHTTDNQFGFKPGHGTENCIFALKHVIDFYINHSSPIYLCFLDLSKAFDRVNHGILWNKLSERGVHSLYIRILNTWYTSQSIAVRWGSCVSDEFYVTNGTRQGSILSPYLFTFYIDDLSFLLRESLLGCYLNGICFNHLLYADDAVLIATSPHALQKLIDICYEFSCENELVFSAKKTKVMRISHNLPKNVECPHFYLNTNKLPLVSEYTYLGVILRNDCKDKSSMNKAKRSIYTKGNLIKSKFQHCDESVKLKLFNSYCGNIYGSALWDTYSEEEYESIKVSHNNVLRYFIKSARADSISQHFVTRNLKNLDVIVRKSMLSLYNRSLGSENSLIQTIVTSVFFTFSKMFKKWKSFIYAL
jgi:hypothetical protein